MSARRKKGELASFGRRGEWVKVRADKGRGLVIVQWIEPGRKQRRQQSWPDTPASREEAVAWAQGRYERIRGGGEASPTRVTLLELWQAFARDQFPSLRPRSQRLYTEYFRKWMTMWGPTFPVEHTTPAMAAEFRERLTKMGRSIGYVRKIVQMAQLVYAWGERSEIISRNRLALYKFKVKKEDRPTPPAEYRAEDFTRILAALDPASATQWRPYVALALCGLQGARQNAVLHARWEDITWGRHVVDDAGALQWVPGRIVWRSGWDKLGKEWSQPLRYQAQLALEIAWHWRAVAESDAPWVLPPGSAKSGSPVYSAQSLWAALRHAETRAGVPHAPFRGAHGLRRLLAGEVAEATGDPLLALHSIGDSDPRMLERYVQVREDRVQGAFAAVEKAAEEES